MMSLTKSSPSLLIVVNVPASTENVETTSKPLKILTPDFEKSQVKRFLGILKNPDNRLNANQKAVFLNYFGLKDGERLPDAFKTKHGIDESVMYCDRY